MLNRSASLMMSTSVLKALPGKLDIKKHSPCILFLSFWYTTLSIFIVYYSLKKPNGETSLFVEK